MTNITTTRGSMAALSDEIITGASSRRLLISSPRDRKKPKYPDRWGIGGGDVGAILGVNQYQSPHDVWLKLTGRLADEQAKDAMEVGLELEGYILRKYSASSGIPFIGSADLCLRDAEYPYRRAHCDGVNVPQQLIADAKVVGLRQAKYWGEPGTDQVPDYVYLQQLWYLTLLDYKASHLPQFRWDDRYKITGYVVGRSPALEKRMVEKVDEFWNENVLKDTPPPVTATEATERYIRESFPVEKTELREADEPEAQLALALKSAIVSRDEWEGKVKDAQVKLQSTIGEAEGIRGPWGYITWKAVKDTIGTDWEAIARKLAPPAALEPWIAANQRVTRKGSRRFTPRFEEE